VDLSLFKTIGAGAVFDLKQTSEVPHQDQKIGVWYAITSL
jgi:hypothetical protein